MQSLYNLSDDQLEFQIVDRAGFKRFLGMKKSDKVPDNKTFWLFRTWNRYDYLGNPRIINV